MAYHCLSLPKDHALILHSKSLQNVSKLIPLFSAVAKKQQQINKHKTIRLLIMTNLKARLHWPTNPDPDPDSISVNISIWIHE